MILATLTSQSEFFVSLLVILKAICQRETHPTIKQLVDFASWCGQQALATKHLYVLRTKKIKAPKIREASFQLESRGDHAP
jgi:hypothetical protein